MIGAWVSWRHLDKEGKAVVPVAGTVAAYAHSATRGFVVLVHQPNGEFAEAEAKNLIAGPAGAERGEPPTAGDTDRLRADLENARTALKYATETSNDALGALEDAMSTRAALQTQMRALGLLAADAAEDPVAAAARLLGELRDELVRVSDESDAVKSERDRFAAEVDRLNVDLEAATKKKPRARSGGAPPVAAE